jgi:glycosyltransferase involved in cell wall biosynthesis
MRIAQVAPLYESVPPKLYGGTERVVSWLTEELVLQGHEVTLFASGDSLTTARLIPICTESLRLNSQCIDHLAHHIRQLEHVLREKDEFDLIHFHIDYLHFPVSRSHALPQVSTVHGRLDIPDLIPLYREFSEMPLISISDSQRGPLSFANWQGTVHHGLPEDSFEPCLTSGEYLAFLGRVSPEKGLDRAIEIAKRCGMPLKVAAKVDRSDRDFFEGRIKPMMKHELIEYVGEIMEHEKNEFLGKAAALLFPIQWQEPFGIVMIEAMACGVPVIAYPWGSVPEIIEDGISGFLVHDIDAAVQAVGRLAEVDRRLCRHQFQKRFTAKRMAQDYLTIYQNLAKSEPRSMALADGELSWMNLESPSSTT